MQCLYIVRDNSGHLHVHIDRPLPEDLLFVSRGNRLVTFAELSGGWEDEDEGGTETTPGTMTPSNHDGTLLGEEGR